MSFSSMTQSQTAGPVPFRYRFNYDIAFQPIIDMRAGNVWAYEALVRGPNGESAQDIIAAIPKTAIYAADQQCRETAISIATQLGMKTRLSLNFLRGALLEPEDYIARTIDFAVTQGFPIDQIILEFSESEQIQNIDESRAVVNRHIQRGFQTAMDDFGAGFQGLSLLCDVHPDVIKLDMSLIRNVDADPRRAKIVAAVAQLCRDLDVCPVCEGVETIAELRCLMDIGIDHFQGFLLARPQLGTLLSPQDTTKAVALGQGKLRTAG